MMPCQTGQGLSEMPKVGNTTMYLKWFWLLQDILVKEGRAWSAQGKSLYSSSFSSDFPLNTALGVSRGPSIYSNGSGTS
jgi:hypothetical protein